VFVENPKANAREAELEEEGVKQRFRLRLKRTGEPAMTFPASGNVAVRAIIEEGQFSLLVAFRAACLKPH
jgi:hypothetical protein